MVIITLTLLDLRIFSSSNNHEKVGEDLFFFLLSFDYEEKGKLRFEEKEFDWSSWNYGRESHTSMSHNYKGKQRKKPKEKHRT